MWTCGQTHATTGYIAIVFSFVTLFWGLYEHAVEWYWYLLLALWIAFVVVAFFVCLILQIVAGFLSAHSSGDKEQKRDASNDGSDDWDDGGN